MPHSPADSSGRLGVVLITWNRRDEAVAAVSRLLELPERPRVVVVDNGSDDGTTAALEGRFGTHPRLIVVRLGHNAGAVARNVGVDQLDTAYVAFCDDDTWWEPGSLARAVDLLDQHPAVAVLTARIFVEPGGKEDPVVAELRDSPVRGADGLPGPALGSFLAGASVLRRTAFRQVGGFSARLWLGGEEELLASDLVAAGWELCYVEDLVVHHHASRQRNPHHRRRVGLRNTLWFTWLRRPWPSALRRCRDLAATVPRDRVTVAATVDAVRGLPWVLRERRVLPPHAERRLRALERSQRDSRARQYVS
jgi:GT2 family glycosyltransferase